MTRYCGFDVETPQDVPEYGLQPWRAATGEATIKSFAVYMDGGELNGAHRMPSKQVLAGLLRHAAAHDITFIGWNVTFDIAWLLALGLGAEVNAVKWIDAMLLLKRLDGWRSPEYGGKGYGLKQVVKETWPQHANYGLAEEDLIAVPQTPEEWERLLSYNWLDSKFTLQLGEKFLGMLSTEERKGARIEAAGIVPVAQSYVQGIAINVPALDELRQSVLVSRAQATMEFQADPTVVASPKKLGQLLFEEWGFAPIKTTPTGAPATDKESLLKLSIQHPEDIRFKGLMELRKCNTRQTKFIQNVIDSMEYHGTNVTRPSPFIAGTYSGRFTYASNQGKGKGKRQTGIALHQWERGKASRSILQAPDGYLLAEFDASGQEMRLMAEASGDETMLTLFEEGIDGHAFMGAAIEGLEWQWIHDEQDNVPAAKEARNMGKFANLSLQYRIGVDTIMVRALVQYGLQLTHPKAQSIKDTYLKTYRGVPKYWDAAILKAKQAGFATTFGHRHIALTNLREWEQQQTAINFPIQGTGGDMKALGIACCRPLFDAECQYGWDLHDALFVYVKDDAKAKGKVLRIQETLNNLPYKAAWGWQPRIALPWDAKIGKTWGSLKAVEG